MLTTNGCSNKEPAWFCAAAAKRGVAELTRPDSASCMLRGVERACEKAAPPSTGPVEIVTKSGVEMVYVPGGEFLMGSDQGNPDEAPAHKVTVSRFPHGQVRGDARDVREGAIARPVALAGQPARSRSSASAGATPSNTATSVRCSEGLKPCYNEKTPDWDCDYSANGYRLPTEAEWEYAARAGTDGPYDFGPPDKLRQYAWFADNAEQKTHPVGQKKPNRWGIYDLYGNVSEWCEDVYSPTYYQDSPAADPHGPPNPGKDVKRVIRGGNWKSSADQCRATARQGERTGDSDACFSTDFCGFRCVRRVTRGRTRSNCQANPSRQ